MKGRPRTPTNLLEARGTFKHDPKRLEKRKDEPRNLPPLGPPPDYLTPEQLEVWKEIVQIAPCDLTEADRHAVEEYSRLMAIARWAPRMDPSDRGKLHALFGRFGMTPADRSRVKGISQEKENKFKTA